MNRSPLQITIFATAGEETCLLDQGLPGLPWIKLTTALSLRKLCSLTHRIPRGSVASWRAGLRLADRLTREQPAPVRTCSVLSRPFWSWWFLQTGLFVSFSFFLSYRPAQTQGDGGDDFQRSFQSPSPFLLETHQEFFS